MNVTKTQAFIETCRDAFNAVQGPPVLLAVARAENLSEMKSHAAQ